MRTTVKATATVTPATEAKTEVVVSISKAIVATIAPLASADATAQAAMRARDKQVVVAGTVTGQDKDLLQILATHGRSPIQKALKPLFVEAYAKAGRDELYAGQQLSRVLSIAFPGGLKPGGKDASPAKRAKAVERAKTMLAKGLEKNEETLTLIALANGSKIYGSDGKLADVKKDGGSGGGNAKPPLDTFTFIVGNAVTAAKEAKLDALQLLNVLIDALKASEMINEEEAEAIGTACTEAL